MKSNMRLSLFIVLVSLSLISCNGYQAASEGSPKVSDSAADKSALATSEPSVLPKPAIEINSIRYFIGGFFGPAGSPNWSVDMVVQFDQEHLGIISVKDIDSFCFKGGELNKDQIALLKESIKNLKLTQKFEGAFMEDAGVETVTVTYSDKQVKTIHLNVDSASFGNTIASNGIELSKWLQDIHKGLARACQ